MSLYLCMVLESVLVSFFFTSGWPVFPAPLVKEVVFFPLADGFFTTETHGSLCHMSISIFNQNLTLFPSLLCAVILNAFLSYYFSNNSFSPNAKPLSFLVDPSIAYYFRDIFISLFFCIKKHYIHLIKVPSFWGTQWTKQFCPLSLPSVYKLVLKVLVFQLDPNFKIPNSLSLGKG